MAVNIEALVKTIEAQNAGNPRVVKGAHELKDKAHELFMDNRLPEFVPSDQRNLDSQFHHPDFVFNKVSQKIIVDGDEIHLTPSQFRLLNAMVESPNEVIPYPRINYLVTGVYNKSLGFVRTHVSHLRELIRHGRESVDPIENIPGEGYKLVMPPDSKNAVNQDQAQIQETDSLDEVQASRIDRVYHHPRFDFDVEERTVTVKGEVKKLSQIEYDIMLLFATFPNILLTYGKLLTDVSVEGNSDNLLKAHISHLRTKLGDEDAEQSVIQNIYGKGYVFKGPEQTSFIEYISSDRDSVVYIVIAPYKFKRLQQVLGEDPRATLKSMMKIMSFAEIADQVRYATGTVKQWARELKIPGYEEKIRIEASYEAIRRNVIKVFGRDPKKGLERALSRSNYEVPIVAQLQGVNAGIVWRWIHFLDIPLEGRETALLWEARSIRNLRTATAVLGPEPAATLRDLVAEGFNDEEIAEKYTTSQISVNAAHINRWRIKLGIKRKHGPQRALKALREQNGKANIPTNGIIFDGSISNGRSEEDVSSDNHQPTVKSDGNAKPPQKFVLRASPFEEVPKISTVAMGETQLELAKAILRIDQVGRFQQTLDSALASVYGDSVPESETISSMINAIKAKIRGAEGKPLNTLPRGTREFVRWFQTTHPDSPLSLAIDAIDRSIDPTS